MKTPHILHLANDYAGSHVYSQLVQAVDKEGIPQTIFTTIRNDDRRGKNAVKFTTEGSIIHYSENWKPYHRISFRCKTASNYKHLLQRVDPATISHVHAHTLFSDGVLALKLKQDFGIPYTVSIRNTDLNLFMRLMIHTWGIGRKVIMNASRVVCISPSHIQRTAQWTLCPTQDFNRKVINIPNGVDNFWIEQMQCTTHKPHNDEPWRILYVGNFTPNKNIPRLMQAVLKLRREHGYNIELNIVGGGGADISKITAMAQQVPDTFFLHGIIKEKEQIRNKMQQCHLFAMPSLHETFGLVYVEALSQGLPVLFTAGEGVDGFFDNNYGVACNPKNLDDIALKLVQMIQDYDSYTIDSAFLKQHFDWTKVAQQYKDIWGITPSNNDM